MNSPSTSSSSFSSSSSLRECRYGIDCYRKNEEHRRLFLHPMKRRLEMEEEGGEGEEKKMKMKVMEGLYLSEVKGLKKKERVLSLNALLLHFHPIIASCHFNFMIDINWLKSEYPASCRDAPMTLVVGDGDRTTWAEMNAEASQYPRLRLARARLPLPYGSHHSKLSLLLSATGLHVVVSTANLIPRDWALKTQGFFVCSSSSSSSASTDTATHPDHFGADLARYLSAYSGSRDWPLIEEWRNRVQQHNFSHVRARVVASVPGYHRDDREQWGHLRLRQLLRSVPCPDDAALIAQFSSIGTLGASADTWLCAQFQKSLCGGRNTAQRLKLVYPTVGDVRQSLEGYMGGGSLPYSSKTASKQPWLVALMHRWRSEQHGRTLAIPHIKSYARITADNRVRWLLLTSANLSKAAWGDLQKNESQLMVRSYEFGVLLDEEDGMDVNVLPYDWPLTKYNATDRPWIVDEVHREIDSTGCSWCPS